jgi:hypothetical protein
MKSTSKNARGWATAALVLTLLVACSPQRQDLQERPVSPFQRFVQGLGAEAVCSREIPVHWSPSLPVPVLVGHRLHYRVFFSGWERRPATGIVLHEAEGDALFSADRKVIECRQRSETGRIIPLEKFPFANLEEFQARLRPLHDSIEEMGGFYARGVPLLDAERARVQAFAREFTLLTGIGHAAAYRALSPEFWVWVEMNGGIGPAPAK